MPGGGRGPSLGAVWAVERRPETTEADQQYPKIGRSAIVRSAWWATAESTCMPDSARPTGHEVDGGRPPVALGGGPAVGMQGTQVNPWIQGGRQDPEHGRNDQGAGWGAVGRVPW